MEEKLKEIGKISKKLILAVKNTYHYNDIQKQINELEKLKFNYSEVSNEISGKYLVYYHKLNETQYSVFLIQLKGIINGGIGFLGSLCLVSELIKKRGTKIVDMGNDGFKNEEDIRAFFRIRPCWFYYNYNCSDTYYFGTKCFDDYDEAKTYYDKITI